MLHATIQGSQFSQTLEIFGDGNSNEEVLDFEEVQKVIEFGDYFYKYFFCPT